MLHCTDGVSTMATGSPLGHIAVWDLDERKLSSIQHDAHRGAVTGLQFIAEQPLLVTSSADISVKVRMYWEGRENGQFVLLCATPRLGYSISQMAVLGC